MDDPKNADDQEDLIDQLDPDRDYKTRTYKEVVEQVREGTLRLQVGETLPQIVHVSNGRVVAGTGVPTHKLTSSDLRNLKANQREARDWFVGRMEGDRPPVKERLPKDLVFDSLMEQAQKGGSKAGEILLTQYIGKAKETSSNTTGKMLEAVIETLRGSDTDRGLHMRVIETPIELEASE